MSKRYKDYEQLPFVPVSRATHGNPDWHPIGERHMAEDIRCDRRRFLGTATGGIGHNLLQEAPQAFAEAVLEVDGY